MTGGNNVLTWLHIGDLPITDAAEQNYRDLKQIAGLMRGLPQGSLDVAILPGDNADDGTPEQFRLVRDAIADLPIKLHILLFLDVVSAGTGGPDFRIDERQFDWIEDQQLGPNRNGRHW